MPTPRLGAPDLVAGQAVPETTVNEQVRYLESAAGHFIFKSRAVATPPGSPADGDCYLVAASPTGAWTGQAGKIAFLVNTAWVFITAIEGFTAWVNDENAFIGFDGATWNVLASPSGTYVPLSYLDTDGTLAANSDTRIASQKAVRTAIAAAIVGMFDLRGSTDCSANPNYPAASKGDTYIVTVAGKIGGASGTSVNVGDIYFATADNAGGTQAAVGASWDVILHAGSLSGALLAANDLSDLASVSTARTNLGLGSIATYAEATAAEIRAATVSRAVSAANLQAAAAFITLTDGATVNWDMSAGFKAKWTLAGSHTLATPTNPKEGIDYQLQVIQDASGSRIPTLPAALSFGSAGAPTFSTGANKIDIVTMTCIDAATPKFRAVFNKDA